MSLKILAILLLAAKLFLTTEIACAEEFALNIKTFPEGTELKPQGEPALLTLTVTAADGQPAPEGWVAVRLDAPPPGRFFSTDFPMVEGSRLVEMRLPVTDGKAAWRQVFPIRGEYRLTAEFSGAAGVKTGKAFNFHVRENERKWLVLGAFVSGLFVIGVIAGRIFSAPRDGNGQTLRLWLLVISICLGAAGKSAWAQEEPKRNYVSKLEIGSATVGTPARIHWSLRPADVNGKPSAKLTLTVTHLEKNREIFSVEKISVAGEFAVDYQFTDGAEHRVTAIAETDDGQTSRQEQTVSVAAVAPPLRAKLRAPLLFLGVIAVGLAAGRWSRRG